MLSKFKTADQVFGQHCVAMDMSFGRRTRAVSGILRREFGSKTSYSTGFCPLRSPIRALLWGKRSSVGQLVDQICNYHIRPSPGSRRAKPKKAKKDPI